MTLLARLRAVRRGAALIGRLRESDRPPNVAAAYAIARALVGRRMHVAGYKIGATSPGGRKVLGLDAPFYGRIVEGSLHRTPATVRLGGRELTIEAEIGCELGVDVPSRTRPYSRAEVASAVRRVVPLVELNRPSFADPMSAGGLCLIADNGVNAGAVLGTPGATGLDAIRTTRVLLGVGSGSAVEGGPMEREPDDPLSALLWLANCLSEHGIGLVTGQVVATGAMTPSIAISQPAVATADFGALGRVQIMFVS